MWVDTLLDLRLDDPVPKFLVKALELSDFYPGESYHVPFDGSPPNFSG